MSHLATLPLGPEAQRRTERQWQSALSRGVPPVDVREVVRASWERSLQLRVPPELRQAPVVWDDDGLRAARDATPWLRLALQAVAAQQGAYAEGGHVLTLFDADGRMLYSEGDPHALEGLQDINFRPGALWAEQVVGTNGPGTALVAGQPVHIVGAEHFCEGWQRWHCAAVPIHDPATHALCGAVDISGPRERAHPYTLTLAVAVAVAVEHMLAAREAEWRAEVLRRYAELAARWPGDATIAVDHTGRVLAASPRAPASLHPLAPQPDSLREALSDLVRASAYDQPREAHLPDAGRSSVDVYPVLEGRHPIGACLVHRARGGIRPPAGGAVRRGAERPTRYTLRDLVGESAALHRARQVAAAAAANAFPVLLLGESGTGKEVFAQGIHAASARAAGPFVAVNCGGLPRELIESELFGYVGGAFSGARREGSAGKAEAADGGTLFLDELGELPPTAQAALLRVLQEGEVTRVGETRPRHVDVRVIAATNCDLDAALASGALRHDLYYRLSVLVVQLPPLRQRADDIPRLAGHFLREAEAEVGRAGCRLSPDALAVLGGHPWPGNVRELRNVMRRLVALCPSDLIRAGDVAAALGAPSAAGAVLPPSAPVGPDHDHDAAARARLTAAVERAATMTEAAAALGITRSTLYRQMERYGVRAGRVVRDRE